MNKTENKQSQDLVNNEMLSALDSQNRSYKKLVLQDSDVYKYFTFVVLTTKVCFLSPLSCQQDL